MRPGAGRGVRRPASRPLNLTRTPTTRRATGRSSAARWRLVLFLRYYAEFRYEEIGAVLGLQSGTVGPTLTAAQATLRELLGGLDL